MAPRPVAPLTRGAEERGPDLRGALVDQLDAEQLALAAGVGEVPHIRLLGHAAVQAGADRGVVSNLMQCGTAHTAQRRERARGSRALHLGNTRAHRTLIVHLLAYGLSSTTGVARTTGARAATAAAASLRGAAAAPLEEEDAAPAGWGLPSFVPGADSTEHARRMTILRARWGGDGVEAAMGAAGFSGAVKTLATPGSSVPAGSLATLELGHLVVLHLDDAVFCNLPRSDELRGQGAGNTKRTAGARSRSRFQTPPAPQLPPPLLATTRPGGAHGVEGSKKHALHGRGSIREVDSA